MKKLGWVERRDKMEKVFPELLGALNLALKYLDHPDVKAIPFVLSAECTANRIRKTIAEAKAIVLKPDPETELRASWGKQGIPKERQDELIRGVEEKAKPGAKIGPWTI